jgi:type III restriction enzyme
MKLNSKKPSAEMDKAFRKYWTALARKTEYDFFDENNLVTEASELISKYLDFVIGSTSSFLIIL